MSDVASFVVRCKDQSHSKSENDASSEASSGSGSGEASDDSSRVFEKKRIAERLRRDYEPNKAVQIVEKSPKGRFERFNIKLGVGSYKTVYLAFDNDTGREVAWNVITFSHLSQHERHRIDEEIKIAKSLDHPKIIRFVNAWINKKKQEVVFATERLTGGSLRSYINRLNGPLKMKVIRDWCRQILEGVAYLHNRPHPVIHRDLKCDNIFINGNDGKVLIGDLGLSTSLRQTSVATSIVGTPEFMAPELYEENYGSAVDIYAFGMCLLEMVGRCFPYSECTTAGQIYKKVIHGELPEVLTRVKDHRLRSIIGRCLSHSAGDRPTASELLGSDFFSDLTTDGDVLCELTPSDCECRHTDIVSLVGGDSSREHSVPMKPKRKGPVREKEEDRRKYERRKITRPASKQPQESRSVTPTSNDAPGEVSKCATVDGAHSYNTAKESSSSMQRPRPSLEQRAGSYSSMVECAKVVASTIRWEDVGAYCQQLGITKVEKVHMLIEYEPDKLQRVFFTYDLSTDSLDSVAQDLLRSDIMRQKISMECLKSMMIDAVLQRICEIAGEKNISEGSGHYSNFEAVMNLSLSSENPEHKSRPVPSRMAQLVVSSQSVQQEMQVPEAKPVSLQVSQTASQTLPSQQVSLPLAPPIVQPLKSNLQLQVPDGVCAISGVRASSDTNLEKMVRQCADEVSRTQSVPFAKSYAPTPPPTHTQSRHQPPTPPRTNAQAMTSINSKPQIPQGPTPLQVQGCVGPDVGMILMSRSLSVDSTRGIGPTPVPTPASGAGKMIKCRDETVDLRIQQSAESANALDSIVEKTLSSMCSGVDTVVGKAVRNPHTCNGSCSGRKSECGGASPLGMATPGGLWKANEPTHPDSLRAAINRQLDPMVLS